MATFPVSTSRTQSAGLAPEHLTQAVDALRDEGYVILENAVDRQHCALLRDKMLADIDTILSRDDTPFNFNIGNIQQDPPPFEPYLFRDVLVNDAVIAVTKSILGAGLKNAFYSGNTALPGREVRQPVHADAGHLWPGMEVATPPFALVVNVLPVDVSPENGSTELWPGTHMDTAVSIDQRDIKVAGEKLEARRKISPPNQPTAPAGSMLIRDMRLWHAGMPNHTATPRPMIAMIHWVSWWAVDRPMVFPQGTERYFEHPDLKSVVNFVDGPINYLGRHQSYDYRPA
jgi:ectoine hydroxylase-related dioxygenase (phytanoyl-CoA dioxygenase family)